MHSLTVNMYRNKLMMDRVMNDFITDNYFVKCIISNYLFSFLKGKINVPMKKKKKKKKGNLLVKHRL